MKSVLQVIHHPTRTARCRVLGSGLIAAWLALSSGAALAHDTWFQVQKSASPPTLWLGTGDRYPVHDSRIEFEYLKRHGCVRHSELAARGAAAGRPLSPLSGPAGRQPTALALRLPAAAAEPGTSVPHSCWVTLVPFDVEIELPKVEVYLKEIGAGPALRAAWAAEHAAGRTWRERFIKHARVEIGAALPLPVGMPLEAVLLQPVSPKAKEAVRFQLLHGGRPLADQPVELISELSKLGLWSRTDAQGQFEATLPLAGNWLLRSTLLRPPAQPGARWESDFVTLAFEVARAEPSTKSAQP
jgi:Domain of unknown function (DUF4198)